MKAVIALSGLAGLVLFGPSLIHSHKTHTIHIVHADAHAPAEVAAHVARDVAGHVDHGDQSRCRFEDELTLEVGVDAGDALQVLAGSGSLEVEGVEGLREVRGVGRACASHEEFLDDLDLTAEMQRGRLVVESHYPDFSGMRSWGNRYARIDLRLEVPMGMVADIQDSSGGMALSGLGDLTVDDSSGEIEANAIYGSVQIDDSSGEIILWDIQGDVEIDDGSGEIEVNGVSGNLTVDDGSGEIDAEDVMGTVRVVRDGSGSIHVDGVGGDFIVNRDGSGSISHRNVEGRIDIPRRGR
jgi:hypothetical protein